MLLSAAMDASHFCSLSNNNSHDGPAGCFRSLRAEPPVQRPRPRHKHGAAASPRPLPPAALPSCSHHREHGHSSSFLPATPECLGVLYGDARQRQFPGYQTVSISEGSSAQLSAEKLRPNFSICLCVPAAGKSPVLASLTFFQRLCEWTTYPPVHSTVGRIWPISSGTI